jgi:DNA-3-methyladenine glycosylase I
MDMIRCEWTKNNPFNNKYHDEEWGVPVHDDIILFEFLVLDAFQAGLSWLTILKKRENFRKAFDNFDPLKISEYGQKKIEMLMKDEGIIRNNLKIKATITNAGGFLKVRDEFGTFDRYIWQFTGFKTIHNQWENMKQIPVRTIESDTMSADLKKRGFKFVGSTICYAFMQAAGMVNDHTKECFRYNQLKTPAEKK